MELVLDHIALLVRDMDRAINAVERLRLCPGDVSDFADEGTRECYVGSPDESGRLLLMQALGPGPYQTAFNKRGPGLHHLAYRVRGLPELEEELGQLGWNRLAHAHLRDVWYARKGSLLLEISDVMQGNFAGTTDQQVSGIRLGQDVKPYQPLQVGRCQIEFGEAGPALCVNWQWIDVPAISE